MDNLKTEEKSPLLLYIVEGETNLSKNNKRDDFNSKGRLYGISSGATTVFTEFPNYVSPCWMTALLSTLTFLIMLLVLVAYMGPQDNMRFPRCTRSADVENLDNTTIYLVHDLNDWTQKQLQMVEKIKNEYQNFNIHLVLIRPSFDKNIKSPAIIVTKPTTVTTTLTTSKPLKKNRAKRSKTNSKRIKHDPIFVPFGIKGLLDFLLHNTMDNKIVKRSINGSETNPSIFNLTELLPTTTTKQQPLTLDNILTGLIVENITMEQAFFNTPLQYTWQKLSPDLKIFAIRILHLWQYGGMSFKINIDDNESDNVEKFSVSPRISMQKITEAESTSNDKLNNFILNGKKTFDQLPNEVVTADDKALHIYTKAPCHVFFGEILMKLKHAKKNATAKKIIKNSLKVFCKHSAVGNNYCRSVFKLAEY
ncbi:unnamed protein product [Ceutorhynchus assimilis]|uniref:Uncharacterized protein n=1 Tax=Ceutorhynchus assimilis TaxID=467358 RepID=A0A9N9MPD5_9CUCU|nr:unnamed protein product [Ceutorhynchus assimilis]